MKASRLPNRVISVGTSLGRVPDGLDARQPRRQGGSAIREAVCGRGVGRRVAVVLLLAELAGCASVEVRGIAAFDPPRAEPWTVYPGALKDARTVRAAFGGDHLGGNAWLKAPVALLDLPLSITADTICLPYDAAVVLSARDTMRATPAPPRAAVSSPSVPVP